MQTLILSGSTRPTPGQKVVRLISRAFCCSLRLEIRHTNTDCAAYLQSLSCNHRARTASTLAVNTLNKLPPGILYLRMSELITTGEVTPILKDQENSTLDCS